MYALSRLCYEELSSGDSKNKNTSLLREVVLSLRQQNALPGSFDEGKITQMEQETLKEVRFSFMMHLHLYRNYMH